MVNWGAEEEGNMQSKKRDSGRSIRNVLEQVRMRQRWRTGWHRLQSHQLFPITPMLSSRLIGRVSQWLRLLSPRLPGGAVLIISQPARLNPSPGALSSKWMKSPRTVFWLHSSTLQQRKRSKHDIRQVHACTDTCVRAHKQAHCPNAVRTPHLFSF